jgi:nucleoside-diphosphate-sugar epimerase
LVHEGYPVRCLARATSDTSRLDGLDVEIAVGDLTRPESLAGAADGCRYVLHCGAIVSDWATVAAIRSANVTGTRNLLDACAGTSVQRVVHISSTDVYGHPGRAAVDEAYAPTGFHNWYAQTKLQSEAEVRHREALGGVETVILRPATVYGPGSTDVIGEIARAISGGHMLLVDRGRAIAGLCYVDNLLDAAVLALRHEAAPGEEFNVTDGLDITWKQFADALAAGLDAPPPRWSMPYWLANAIGLSLEHGYRLVRRATGLSTTPLLSRQAVGVLGRNQDFSNRKLRDVLGWQPQVDYETGLQQTLEWLRDDYLKVR